MFIVGVVLINFLQPKADVRTIQLSAGPKVIALLIIFIGLIILIIGIIQAV